MRVLINSTIIFLGVIQHLLNLRHWMLHWQYFPWPPQKFQSITEHSIQIYHWHPGSHSLTILGVTEVEKDNNTYHCGSVYVPSDCWTGWNVHGRCHIHKVFHPCVYEDDVSVWMCQDLHMYSVDTEQKKQKQTQQLITVIWPFPFPSMIAKQNYSISWFFHITALEEYYEIKSSLNIHTMNQKCHPA